jgi:hypothetical protein
MVKNISHLYLGPDQLKFLKDFKEPVVYHHEEFLVYKKHIPQAAFCLLEGEVLLKKTKTNIIKLSPFCLIGFKECLENIALKYDIIVEAGSKILVIPKYHLRHNQIYSLLMESQQTA